MSNSKGPSDEDKALFRQAFASIKPISKKVDSALVRQAPLFLSDTWEYKLEPNAALFYSQSSLSKQTLTQLKRGELPIERKLDLHGLNLQEAKEKLIDFMQQAIAERCRFLLVIPGKGKRTGHAPLKNQLNHWLPQIPQVLAFCSALPRDGGGGAVYVLLKRS